jgi:mono/diheme cytochrome c family protein
MRLAAIILDGIQGRVGNYQAVMPGWGPILQDAEIAAVMTWLRGGDGKGPVTAVEVSHARIETVGRNTFWTVEDLRNLQLR